MPRHTTGLTYMDTVFSTPKSVSVVSLAASGFAEAQQAAIAAAYAEVCAQALALIEREGVSSS